MSFDLYVQSFKDGAPVGIPLDFIRQIFGAHLSEVEPDYWTLTFAANESCSLFPSFLNDTTDLIQSLSIGNPCDELDLWQCLLDLMGFGHTVLYFPGCSGPLVLDLLTVSHMPSDLLASLGTPNVVDTAHGIQELVRAA